MELLIAVGLLLIVVIAVGWWFISFKENEDDQERLDQEQGELYMELIDEGMDPEEAKAVVWMEDQQ